MKKLHYLLLASTCMLCACSSGEKQPESALMKNEARITEIISEMTLEEKVNMLHGKNMFSSAGVERLGIADMEYADGPFGIREEMEPHSWNPLNLATDSATFFPTGSALAATWSTDMAYLYGEGMAKEARRRGKDMILGPAINIQRIPTGGRTYEYFSEDPLLAGALAVGYTKGVQDNGVAVCLKHYALNNQENHRGYVDVQVSPRAMHELYLRPFEDAIRKADAYGVMAAYNKVAGYWCSENHMLQEEILRDMWGFKGMIISDWGGTHSVQAAVNGLEVEMPGSQYLGQALLDSVKAGVIPESIIDKRVRNILRVRLAIEPIPASEANKEMASQPEQQQTAYEVAKRSIVLLKNKNQLLPIDLNKSKKIAVIGANAVTKQAQGGVGAGVKALVEITPLEGLLQRIGDKAEVRYAQGYPTYTRMERYRGISPIQEADKELMKEAVALAAESDLVIFVAGNNREIETEGSDRDNIALPMGQAQLAAALKQANPNLVTVLVTGAPIELYPIEPISDAMLVSWFNGSMGGLALADVLLGEVSPSGKLPFTFPITLQDVPAYKMNTYPQQFSEETSDVFVDLVNRQKDRTQRQLLAHYSEGIFVGYRWYDTKQQPVMYPFGHGLSYATFQYEGIQANVKKNAVEVTFTLTNNGAMQAEEVVQLYASRPESAIERPAQELKAFQRVSLAPGESKQVALTIPRDDFRHWDEAIGGWQVESGKVVLRVGTSSRELSLQTEIQL